MKLKGHSRLFSTSATLIVATFATSSVFAASATWNGTTNATWATDTNWSATPAPGAGDTATFNNVGNANTTIDLGAGVSVGNIVFDTADAASYILGAGAVGSQTLALGGSGSISLAATVINNQAINANLNLGTAAGAEAFTITNNKAAASNTLTLAGGVSTLLSGVKTLTVAGTGVVNISGAINNGSGTLSLNKTGANVLTLSGPGNYSGGTLVSGVLVAANSTALGSGPVTINAAAGNQLQLGAGVNVANPLTISGGGAVAQGVLWVPTGNATYSGTISAAVQQAGGHLATAGYIDNSLTIAGDNTITSAVPVTVRNGTIKITGAQNYTGGTSMNGAAFIQFGKINSMPATGSVVTLANGVVAVNAGGAGEFTAGAGAGTIGGLVSGIGGQGGPVTWVANTTLGIDTTNAVGTLSHSGAFTPAVAVGLIKLGPGTLELTGGGTYASSANIVGTMPLIVRQGTLLLNGGTHAVTGEIGVGTTFGVAAGGAGYNAKLQIDSGALSTTSWLSVCKGNGIGTVSSDLEINNAATVTAVNFSGGWNNNATTNLPKGSVTLNGTASLSVNNNVHIAESAGSNFTFNLNGTSTFSQTANANQTTIGMGANSVGVFNVNGGTASFHRDLIIGGNNVGASGKLILNSGTVHAATTVERWLIINPGNTSSGQIDINGGNLNLNSNTDLRFSTAAASGGTNVVNLNGGSITGLTGNNNGIFSGASVLDLNQGSTAATVNNTFNLAGGTLTIGQVITNNDAGTVAFNFNGGTLRAAASNANFVNLSGATQSVNVLAGGAIIDSNGNNVTIVDGLKAGTGNGGLTKLGAGNLSLDGDNTYTGATLVSAGSLTLTNAGNVNTSSSVTVNGSDAKLVQANFQSISTPITITQGSLDGNGTISSVNVASGAGNSISAGAGNAGILSIGTLTFQGAAALNLRATGTSPDQTLSVTDLNTSASGDVVVNATNTTSVWANGSYPLVTYSTFNGTISDFALGTIDGLLASQTASIQDTGFSIDLVIEGEALVWTGNIDGNWTTGGAANWSFENNPATFSANSPVIFNDGASLFTVSISGANVSPSAVIFEGSNDYTINGPSGIATGSIIHNGFGTVTLASTHTFTGPTTINSGILQLGDGATDGSIATSSSISVNNSGGLVFDLVGNHTYSNPIAGSSTGTVIKRGPGTLTLSGANTFAGNFTQDAGGLNLNSAGSLGAGPGIITINGGTLDNTSGATVFMTPNKNQTWNADITFTGTNDLFMSNGAVTIAGPRTVNVQAGTFGVGAVTDGGAGYDLVKTGPGTLVLNGTANNFAGNLDIQNGIVGASQDIFAAAPIGTGILQNSGAVGTKWTRWTGSTSVTSNVLIRNNDGSNLFQLGIIKLGTGSLTLTNNSNFATANLAVDGGRLVLSGTGTYGAQFDDGTTNTGLTSIIGNTGGANGVLEINGPTVTYNNRSNPGAEPWRSTLTIGNNGTGAGAVRFTSGTLTLDRQLAIGGAAGASGGYTQTGGQATIGGFLAIGLGTASGAFNLSGGTFTSTAGPVTNGAGAGSLGVMNLGGNSVYNHNSPANNAIWLGENGSGTMNVTDNAALNVPTNGIELGRLSVATSSGTLNLLGGNVTTNSVSKPGALATGVLNFNGGRLTANTASATFLGGLTSAYVHSGGGTIDNGGNAITIAQPLLAPTGNGVGAAGPASGSGFITTPLVTITGDGTGATAVANIDGSGNLLGITVTNPGVGYSNPPTFALVGGGIGNTGTVNGPATLAANTSGGLTFTGAATTTLAGVNTYTGNTVVNSGSTLLLADNAGLKFVIGNNGVSNKLTGAGTAMINGDFTIDLSGAAIADNNTWTLVDTTSKMFDFVTFTVNGFTELGTTGVHQLVSGNNTWTFTESTGQLKLNVAAGGGYTSWANANANGEAANLDFDKDGMPNGVEFFMGATGSSFTPNPSVVTTGSNRTITWPKSPSFTGSYQVKISSNLGTWTNATTGVVNNPTSVVYTLPSGPTEIFVRLEVTPN